MDYGTGAIFGCPAHDQRALDFVNKYGLGNTPVVCPPGADPKTFVITDTAYDGDGRMINSRFLDGMTIEQAKEEIARRLEGELRGNMPVGERQVNFRLRDWGISRQRYWGCPIPVIHCPKCDVVPVPDDQLPVVLPEDATFDKPGNALDHHPTWRHVTCPKCGAKAQRETDTMDTFVDSSWYFARFTDPWIEKMSKSKRNTVDPDDIIATYGADVARWFMLSDSPPDRDVIWSDERVQGASRFVQRLWRLVNESAEIAKMAPADRPASFGADALGFGKAAPGAVDNVSTRISRLHFNVCLAYIPEFFYPL